MKAESFDVIMVAHILEHLHFPLILGSEIRRVLKKGGRVYVETPNWTSVFVPSFGYKRHFLFPTGVVQAPRGKGRDSPQLCKTSFRPNCCLVGIVHGQ